MSDAKRSIEEALHALYACISFPPGGEPDFKELRRVLVPYAKLSHVRTGETIAPQVMDVDTFIERFRKGLDAGLREKGFIEREVARRLEEFGAIAHAFSTYESRYTASDPTPFNSGINSIQLLQDPDESWRVFSIVWDDELPSNPIPAQYRAIR